MPRYADASLPPEVERAVQILSINRARLAILTALAQTEHMTASAIAETTGVTRTMVGEHLRELEQLGAVHASQPATPERRRVALTWTLDRTLLRQEINSLLRLL